MADAMTAPLTVALYGVDNPNVTRLAMEWLRRTSTPGVSRLVLVDNGSDPPFEAWGADELIRLPENIGGNAIFHRLHAEGRLPITEYTAYLHCDLIVREPGWDQRVVDAFRDNDLDLLGFVGSDEIDTAGGRGAGTSLNYLGEHYEGIGQASPYNHHGRRLTGLMPASVVDHCSMIFRTETLLALTPQEGHYAPEHFMDRILCCEVLERGGRIAVLGIACDHFGGGIGPGNAKADALRRKWLDAEGIPYDPARSDLAVYLESERRFFTKYRDTGLFPIRVRPNWAVEQYRNGGWVRRPH